MRDRGLGHVVPGSDVAGTDRPGQRELAEDGQPDRVGGGLEEQDLGIRLALHATQCIDKCILRQVSIQSHSRNGDPP